MKKFFVKATLFLTPFVPFFSGCNETQKPESDQQTVVQQFNSPSPTPDLSPETKVAEEKKPKVFKVENTGDPAKKAISFYEGLMNTFYENTGDGWESAQHKEQALAALNLYIDIEGKKCGLDKGHLNFLKSEIRKFSESDNEIFTDKNGEKFSRTELAGGENNHFTPVDIGDAFTNMAARLGQNKVDVQLLQKIIEVSRNREDDRGNIGNQFYDPDPVLPVTQLADFIKDR